MITKKFNPSGVANNETNIQWELEMGLEKKKIHFSFFTSSVQQYKQNLLYFFFVFHDLPKTDTYNSAHTDMSIDVIVYEKKTSKAKKFLRLLPNT